MSYSAVNPVTGLDPNYHWGVSIRLAFSDDDGSSWEDANVVVAPFTMAFIGGDDMGVTNPNEKIPPNTLGLWQRETSTLIYDPAAPESERWKIIWSDHLKANGIAYWVDYSWLGYKAAASPFDLEDAEPYKLFAGFNVQKDGDNAAAPAFSPLGKEPMIRLDKQITKAAAGADLAELTHRVFAEPGFYATQEALYLSAYSIDAILKDESIVMFRCPQPCRIMQASGWEYLGKTLTQTDAEQIGSHHYQAPAVFKDGEQHYLVATPVEVKPDEIPAYRYDGCRVLRFSDLSKGLLVRENGIPVEELVVDGNKTLHHGACNAITGLNGGIMYSSFEPHDPPMTFKVFVGH